MYLKPPPNFFIYLKPPPNSSTYQQVPPSRWRRAPASPRSGRGGGGCSVPGLDLTSA